MAIDAKNASDPWAPIPTITGGIPSFTMPATAPLVDEPRVQLLEQRVEQLETQVEQLVALMEARANVR
jgi:hypothetical protein